MAQLEGSRKYIDTPNTTTTPKGQHSPTFQQLLQGDGSWHYSTSPVLAGHHDQEEVFSPSISSSNKSVLTRVKERAKKLRASLSMKKKQENEVVDDRTTPSWGASLEDNDDEEEEEDEDPEYLGAPMYESELAPEALKETLRQHPRANPVVSENHICPSHAKRDDEEKDKPVIHNQTITETVNSKTITETVTEKLAPAYAAVSDATQTVASKFASLTTSAGPEEEQKYTDPDIKHTTAAADGNGRKNLDGCPEIRDNFTTKSPQKWDKGVSVKEYFMNKLEPGEDDRALSQVISDAISPKKTSTDMGVVEKVREAVASLLRHEESSRETIKATSFPSKIRSISADKKVPPPNSIASIIAISSSEFPMSPRASPTQEPIFKRTMKATSVPSSTPYSSKTHVPSQNPISSTKSNSPYVPMSHSSSSVEEPSRQTSKAKHLSSTNRVSPVTKGTAPNSISSTNVQSSSGMLVSHNASSTGQPAKKTIEAPKVSSSIPISAKTEAPPRNFIFSTNANRSSNAPMSSSANLTSHVPAAKSANSSPHIPISTNAQEVFEDQSHGRILQAN